MLLTLKNLTDTPSLMGLLCESHKTKEPSSEQLADRIQALFLQKEYGEVGKLLALQTEDSLRSIKLLLKGAPNALFQAISSTVTILESDAHLWLTAGKVARIVFFIETEFAALIAKKEYVVTGEKTDSKAIIEYDPETKKIFIYPEDKKDGQLGSGGQKVVSKAIMYDGATPEIVALCRTDKIWENEVKYTRSLQGSRGIVELHAIIRRPPYQDKLDRLLIALRQYSAASLKSIFENRTYTLTLPEKCTIALDLLSGLMAMHDQGLMHADLHSGNFLVHVTKKTDQKRDVKAAICDFGRTTLKRDTRGILCTQIHPFLRAPESCLYEYLSGDDYEYTDIFALGCSLYQLYYEKELPWEKQGDNFFQTRATLAELQQDKQTFAQAINNALRPRKRALSGWCCFGKKLSAEERFEALILRMLDPTPKSRGTLAVLVQDMQQIHAAIQR